MGGDCQRLDPNNILGPAWQVNLTGRDHGGYPTVHTGFDPTQLTLARRPVAEYRMGMGIDQSGRNRRALTVDDLGRTGDVTVLVARHRRDDSVVNHDCVGIQNRLVDIT